MDLWILNPNYERVGIVDTASSIIWSNRYRQCGDFEIYIPASAERLELLQEDFLVVREDDDMVGIIETVELTTDAETGDYLTITGRDLRSILDRRIVWDQTSLNGTVEDIMRQLVTDAFISPTNELRKYDKLTLADPHGYTDTASAQFTGDNLLEAIEGLCATYNYGFKITLEDGILVLDFYKGTDRSVSQSENPHVVFSEEYGNLTASTYTRDKTGYKNIALVAGEGEGKARKRVPAQKLINGASPAGLLRREMFVDARDLSTNEGEINDALYALKLLMRGSTYLSEAAIVESVEGTVNALQMYTYKKDYFLGDIVTVANRYRIQADTQLLETVETWDENGYTCEPTYG